MMSRIDNYIHKRFTRGGCLNLLISGKLSVMSAKVITFNLREIFLKRNIVDCMLESHQLKFLLLIEK